LDEIFISNISKALSFNKTNFSKKTNLKTDDYYLDTSDIFDKMEDLDVKKSQSL